MNRNYSTMVSLAAFVVALPLPLMAASIFTAQVGHLGYRVGAGIHLLIILWVGAWTLVGLITGVVGLVLSFRECGSRWLAIVATGVNLLFLPQMVGAFKLVLTFAAWN